MNGRNIALYNYLLENGDKWVSQAQVARDLFELFGNGECFFEPKDYHETPERKLLGKAIAEINSNQSFEKIIISSCKGIKLANEAEFDRYIKSQYSATIRKLSRIYKMAKKGNRHNQIDFGGHTVESFLQNLPENT